MRDEYKSICDKCHKRTWYETEQQCHMEYPKGKTCDLGHWHEYDPIKMERCTGTLKIIDTSNLANKFKHYHETGQRIEVKTSYGEILRGYVGKTTGWKPSYLLMARSNSAGSSDLLGEKDEIVKTINRYR